MPPTVVFVHNNKEGDLGHHAPQHRIQWQPSVGR
jgi:hypothetical protein